MRKRVALGAAAVIVLALVVGGVWWQRQQREAEQDAAAQQTLTAYLAGWAAKDMTSVPFEDPAAPEDFAAAVEGLGDSTVTVDAPGVVRDGSTAGSEVTVTWTLTGDVPWTYAVPVQLVETDGTWLVAPPAAGSPWQPDLEAGGTMSLEKTTGQRGDLLDREGDPLMPASTVHVISLDPVQGTPESAAALEEVVGASAGSLVDSLTEATASGSKAPIPVITYRESDYAPREAALGDIAGVVDRESELPLARTRTFAQPLLGSVGEVTAEMIENSDGRFVAGDRAGRSGLQAQYDEQLAGVPGTRVVSDTGAVLFEQAAVDGTDVETTLDPAVQEAAEKALAQADLSVPGALVAVDVPSGEVLASANSPTSGFDRAITGRYPPGSTFKVATTYAYLTRGITTPSSVVPCPPSVTIDGREFRNYEGESISGKPTFVDDFAASCNTAFVSLSPQLESDDLRTAAGALGVGADWGDTVGVDGAFAGSIPETSGGTDAAAASIGQGRNEVSPLSLAVMVGSIGRGTYLAPVLVRDPDGPAARPAALDGEAVADIRSMMAEVVARGSGTALRSTPGGPVRGKTGTAEHGTDPDLLPRVWFVGYQGDVAFAVLVEEGKNGGTVAAPIAADFLTNLAAG
ncbi:MAG: penicillin-binding transpeptidase domain-containing protein [Ornithinibacter sp.]